MTFNPDTKGISKTSMLLIENKGICTMRGWVHKGILVSLSYLLLLALHGSLHWVTEYMQIFYLHVQYPWSHKGFVHEADKIKMVGKGLAGFLCIKCIYFLSEKINLRRTVPDIFSQLSYNLFPQINSTLCSNASDGGQLYWVVIKLDSHPFASICISFSILFLIQR